MMKMKIWKKKIPLFFEPSVEPCRVGKLKYMICRYFNSSSEILVNIKEEETMMRPMTFLQRITKHYCNHIINIIILENNHHYHTLFQSWIWHSNMIATRKDQGVN